MNYSLQKLQNSLPVILAPLKGTQTVTVLFLVAAGSKYETKKQNGISHFLEHMFFKGTPKRPNTLKISEALDKVGGVYNAFTGKEFTGFYAKLAHQHFELALDVLADILQNSLFDAQALERERGVILEEINLYKDTPTAYIDELFEELLYGNTPAGRKIIGTVDNVKSFSSEQLKKYFKNHYSSLNSCVIIAGNLNNNSLKKVDQYFGHFPKRNFGKKKKVLEEQNKPVALSLYKKTDQTHLCLGVRTFDMFDKRKYALSLLSILLGGGMSSRLFTNIREKEGLAYYIKSNPEAYTDTGYLSVLAGIKHENLEKTVQLILREFKVLKDIPPTEAELNKAKEYLKGTTLMSLETSQSVASFVGRQYLLKKDIEKPMEMFQKISKISPQEIQKLAQQIFTVDNLNLSIISSLKYTNQKLQNLLTFN
jgi:predicted Zn-dependent peptidase